MHKYINKNTFEIVDNIFEVDEYIADTISVLNKKGYYTLYCCSGHSRDPRLYEKYHIEKTDDCNYNTIDAYVVDENTNSYNLLKAYTDTEIYIMFNKDYKFNNLPYEFYKDDNNIIRSNKINYYNGNKRKNWNDIDKEIKNLNNILLDWAKKLPSLNK